MKKLFALCLALAMLLPLCACGGKTSKEEMIGTWERKVNGDSGDTIKQVIEVYEGGTGLYHYESENTHKHGSFDATWEMKDGVLNLTYTFVTRGFSIDTSTQPMTLTDVGDSSAVFYKVEDAQ